jgi:hypothetical protein
MAGTRERFKVYFLKQIITHPLPAFSLVAPLLLMLKEHL